MDPVEIVGGEAEYEKLKAGARSAGFELVIKNQWLHWIFLAAGGRVLEWWPSTGRVVINKNYAASLRERSVTGILVLLHGIEPPKKPAPNLSAYAWSVWTDGSTDPNPGRGGCAFVAQHKHGRKLELAVGYQLTTISRMELQAVEYALLSILEIDPNPSVVIFTDSRYVQRSMMEWIKRWRRNGWITQEGQPVDNRDLLEKIDEYVSRCLVVRFQKIAAHRNAGTMNDYVDELARGVRRSGPWLPDHGYLARLRMRDMSGEEV